MPGTRIAVGGPFALLGGRGRGRPARRGAPAGEWPSYGGDVGSTKYSPLDRVDAGNFGDGGRVDLMEGLPRANRGERDYLNALLYSMQSPPVVVRDVVVTGASIADRRITRESIPGWVRVWDARTGELRWVFRTVPREGDEGVETWGDDSWRYSGNANVWTMLSGDNENGIVYLPVGTATNDFYGGHRPGDNLYSESLVAVDVPRCRKVCRCSSLPTRG